MRDLWASAPVEERRLLSDLPGRLDFRQCVNTPEIAEQVDRRWPITRELCRIRDYADLSLVANPFSLNKRLSRPSDALIKSA